MIALLIIASGFVVILPSLALRHYVYWSNEEQRLRCLMLEERIAALEFRLEIEPKVNVYYGDVPKPSDNCKVSYFLKGKSRITSVECEP